MHLILAGLAGLLLYTLLQMAIAAAAMFDLPRTVRAAT